MYVGSSCMMLGKIRVPTCCEENHRRWLPDYGNMGGRQLNGANRGAIVHCSREKERDLPSRVDPNRSLADDGELSQLLLVHCALAIGGHDGQSTGGDKGGA